jgi:hypothetical protein
MGNWYKTAKAKKIIIPPDIKSKIESLGWLDALNEELQHIGPSVQSGNYRVSLSAPHGGRDFSLQLGISPTEVRVIDVSPMQFDNSPLLETVEHGSFFERTLS